MGTVYLVLYLWQLEGSASAMTTLEFPTVADCHRAGKGAVKGKPLYHNMDYMCIVKESK